METIKITTPENIEVEYKLAGLGSRTGAALIDNLIQISVIGSIVLVLILSGFTSSNFYDQYQGWIIGISLILVFLITYGYFITFELIMNGRTPGKKLFHLRTIRNNGQPITAKHSIIRNLFRVTIDMLGIGVIVMFFTKQHKRIGDYLASTVVIMEEKKKIFSLDELKSNDKATYKYAITESEYNLLKDYFSRKDSLSDNGENIRNKLAKYFIQKLEMELTENEYDILLSDLLHSRG